MKQVRAKKKSRGDSSCSTVKTAPASFPRSNPSPSQFEETEIPLIDLNPLEEWCGKVDVHAPHDEILTRLLRTSALADRVKALKQGVDLLAIAWIDLHGPLAYDTFEFRVVRPKTVKCVKVLECLDYLLRHCEGDISKLAEYLRSDPFKYGACAQVLSESDWNRVFREDRGERLSLERVDTRFIRSRP